MNPHIQKSANSRRELTIMGRVYVDLACMERAADDFGITLKAIRDELETLERDLGVHLKEWEGDAQRSYKAFHDEWHLAAREMSDSLAGLRKKVVRAHTNYHSARSASLQTWRRR
jgi:WXG100 family type VII secretion target